jgi:hypothetical protein
MAVFKDAAIPEVLLYFGRSFFAHTQIWLTSLTCISSWYSALNETLSAYGFMEKIKFFEEVFEYGVFHGISSYQENKPLKIKD